MGRKSGEKVGLVHCHGMGGNQVLSFFYSQSSTETLLANYVGPFYLKNFPSLILQDLKPFKSNSIFDWPKHL